jgi:hypothetical protein
MSCAQFPRWFHENEAQVRGCSGAGGALGSLCGARRPRVCPETAQGSSMSILYDFAATAATTIVVVVFWWWFYFFYFFEIFRLIVSFPLSGIFDFVDVFLTYFHSPTLDAQKVEYLLVYPRDLQKRALGRDRSDTLQRRLLL